MPRPKGFKVSPETRERVFCRDQIFRAGIPLPSGCRN